jgi:D-alanyl-D-alanine carboxypeptidase
MIDRTEAFAALDEYYDRKMIVNNIPGMALAVTDRERTLHRLSRGYADLASRTKVTDETLFQIGSISKSFTAIALLQLMERGKLDIRAPVTEYLPWFRVGSKYGPITLHHLMTHTAGIPIGTDSSVAAESEVWSLREVNTGAPPGEFFHYSNTGYKALGLVLEAVTGMKCSEVVMKRVVKPLGMTKTFTSITNDLRKMTSVGYTWLHDELPAGRKAELAPAAWTESTSADGSISSVAEDMAAYIRMLLRRGVGPDGRIVSEESFRLMTGRYIQPLDNHHGEHYGYGVNVEDDAGHQLVWHGGGMIGHTSSMLMDMDLGIGIVMLTNSPSGPEDMPRHSIRVMRATSEGSALPEPVINPHACMPKNPDEYSGEYHCGSGVVCISVKDGLLIAAVRGEEFALEGLKEDYFLLDNERFRRFPLRFIRARGTITGVVHGPDTYVLRSANAPKTNGDIPDSWKAYIGHYRSHNPWTQYYSFRVIARDGSLVLVNPCEGEVPMEPLPDGSFRLGENPRIPEMLRFDMVIGGKAYRACLSGGYLHRSFVE